MAAGDSYDGIVVPEGDPGALEASAGRLRATAGLLDAAAGALQGLLGGMTWTGPASAQHASLTGTQTTMATTGAGALLGQATVITDYAQVLQDAQRRAERAIEHARDADRRIHRAEEDIRQAVADQGAAQERIAAARTAQEVAHARMVTAVVDAVAGDGTAAAAADAAAAEEADARRDLHAAQERERHARRRLEQAREDRRDAQRAGREAAESVEIARGSLVAAAQGAGLLPTQPGGPADPAFAAAAGIALPRPPAPPKPPEHRSWLERRLDDVGDAASWTWDQVKEVPGGAWDGVKGMYQGVEFVEGLNPLDPRNLADPGRLAHNYDQLGHAAEFAWDHPGEFGKQLINWEDLKNGDYGHWLGNLAPDAALAFATGGAGTVVTRSARITRATEKLAEGERALTRATDIQSRMPTEPFITKKTFAAHDGPEEHLSISGDAYDVQRRMLERVGEDPGLLQTTSSAEVRDAMSAAGHDLPAHPFDARHGEPGWYHGTHAELKLTVADPAKPVGVTRAPCSQSCDPGLAKLAQHHQQDIVVAHPGSTDLYRADGTKVVGASPEDFTGVNSRWPGALWGVGGGGAGLGAQAAAPTP